jgi:WD40 repeat protein
VSVAAPAQLNGRPVVISGSQDTTVRVWDLATGQPIGAPFTGHADFVGSVATAQLNGARW